MTEEQDIAAEAQAEANRWMNEALAAQAQVRAWAQAVQQATGKSDLRTPDEVLEAVAQRNRIRGTGGNGFIPADATSADLMRSINDQLGDLREWVIDDHRFLDLGEITISTKRIANGSISVTVSADLQPKKGSRDRQER